MTAIVITLLVLWLLGIPIAMCIVVVGHNARIPRDEIESAAKKAVVFWPWPFIGGWMQRRRLR